MSQLHSLRRDADLATAKSDDLKLLQLNDTDNNRCVEQIRDKKMVSSTGAEQ